MYYYNIRYIYNFVLKLIIFCNKCWGVAWGSFRFSFFLSLADHMPDECVRGKQ